jgi:hypothetical protein
MVSVATVGTIIILAGMIVCTDRADQYWSNRTPRPHTTTTQMPFITSLTQCKDCGLDGDLLNLDRQCLTCFHLHERTAHHA